MHENWRLKRQSSPVLDEVLQGLREIAAKLDTPRSLIPTVGYDSGAELPFVYQDEQGNLHWAQSERGSIRTDEVIDDVPGVLLLIADCVADQQSYQWSQEQDKSKYDSQRVYRFERYIDLMGLLGDPYRQHAVDRVREHLARGPLRPTEARWADRLLDLVADPPPGQ